MQGDEIYVRSPHELMLDAMLECLPANLANDDPALIHALRWQGFNLSEIEQHIDEIKRRRNKWEA